MDDNSIKHVCPQTGHTLSMRAASPGDAEAARDAEMSNETYVCPACGQKHIWDKPRGEMTATVRQ